MSLIAYWYRYLIYYVYLQKFTFEYNYCDRLFTTTYKIF